MRYIASYYKTLFSRRELIWEMARQEFRDRHAGQVLGCLWVFGHPLIMMVIYMVLFTYVFPARFGEGASVGDYSVSIFAGLVPWLAFQDLLNRAPSTLTGHANLVKQVVFPLEVLPVKMTLASVIPYSIGVAFVLVWAGINGTLSWLVLALPFLVICQLVAMAGAAFLLTVGGVFFRDIREIIQVLCAINLFAQPILFNPFSSSKLLNTFFLFNPFSYLTWCWQDALFHGRFVHPWAWVAFPLGSLLLLAIGLALFDRTRGWFGDAL